MDNYKREIAFILFRRWPLIIATAAAVTIVAVFIVLFWPRTYGAEGSLLIKGSRLERAPEALEDTQLRPTSVSEEDLISQVAILTSRELMRRTVEDLKNQGMSNLLATLGSTDRSQARKLEGSIEANVVPTSNVIRVTFTHSDRTAATLLLSALIRNFITYQQEVFSPQTVSSFLSDQMRRFQVDLRTKNDQMADLIQSTGLTSVELQIEQNLVLKRELQSQLTQAETDALNQSALIQRIDEELRSSGVSLFTFVENLGIQALSDKLQLALVERADLARRYRPDGTSSISRYDAMIEDLYTQLRREVLGIREETNARYDVARQRIQELSGRIQAIDNENVLLRTNYLKLKEMEREAEIIQTSYETFFRRNEEAIIQTSGGSGFVTSYVSLVQPPTALDAPVFPRTLPILAAGVFAGIFLGLALGFFAELQDHTLKRPEEIQRRLGIPILFSIGDVYDEPFPKINRELLLVRGGLILILILVTGIVWRLVVSVQELESDPFQVDPTTALTRERESSAVPIPSVDLDGVDNDAPEPSEAGDNGSMLSLIERTFETISGEGAAPPDSDGVEAPTPMGDARGPTVMEDDGGLEADRGERPGDRVEVLIGQDTAGSAPTSEVQSDSQSGPTLDVVNPSKAAFHLISGSVIYEMQDGDKYTLEVISALQQEDLQPYLNVLVETGFAARIEETNSAGKAQFSLLLENFGSYEEAEIIRSEIIGGLMTSD